MTENKRFTIENDVEMKDNWNINKRCYHFQNGFDAKDCYNMLNELQDENQELKQEVLFWRNLAEHRKRYLNDNKRFKETVSTGAVTDTTTGKEYNCEYRINDELLELINKIAEENMMLKDENAYYELLLMSLEETARKFCEVPRVKND